MLQFAQQMYTDIRVRVRKMIYGGIIGGKYGKKKLNWNYWHFVHCWCFCAFVRLKYLAVRNDFCSYASVCFRVKSAQQWRFF